MVFSCRYFDIDETGKVISGRTVPLENSIDAINMVEPEMPTDAIYELYYNETEGLHWEKVAEFEEDLGDAADPVMEKLESIDAKIQTNEDLQTFYDDIVREVGL